MSGVLCDEEPRPGSDVLMFDVRDSSGVICQALVAPGEVVYTVFGYFYNPNIPRGEISARRPPRFEHDATGRFWVGWE